MKKEAMLVTGAGQISMAIARRIGFGKKIILGDKNIENANIIQSLRSSSEIPHAPIHLTLAIHLISIG